MKGSQNWNSESTQGNQAEREAQMVPTTHMESSSTLKLAKDENEKTLEPPCGHLSL